MSDTKTETSGNVAVREPDAVLEKNELPTALAETVDKFLAGDFVTGSDDPEQVMRDITAQVLSAQSVDEVLSGGEAIGLRQLLDQAITVRGFKFNRSTIEEGKPFYAVIDAEVKDTGEIVAATCGAQKIIAQLFRLAQLGAFPLDVVCRQAKRPTANGYFPLRLDKP